jgi:hypothetical protein
MPTPLPFRSPDASTAKATFYKRTTSSLAHPVWIAGLLLLVLAVQGFAQQRVIVNPTFMQRFQRDHTPLPDYNCSVPSASSVSGCFRYLGDAQCKDPGPGHTPVDDQGCMAGWSSTDPYNGNDRSPDIQDGYIKEPTQVGFGTNVEGLNVPNGAAELNAENAGRLYQKVCLADGEVIPFSYSLGDPVSTFSDFSQARFGIFLDTTDYPGTAVSTADSSVVSTQTMMPQSGMHCRGGRDRNRRRYTGTSIAAPKL